MTTYNKTFEYSKSANCWMGEFLFMGKTYSLEIYMESYVGEQINWDEVEEFRIESIPTDSFDVLVIKAKKLLLDFMKYISYEVKKIYQFELIGISYKGKHHGLYFSSKTYSYELQFAQHSNSMVESEDPYGLYFVDVDCFMITGVRREQV